MTAKRVAAAAVVAIGTGLALTGCAPPQVGQIETTGRVVPLPDGRSVVCVVNIDTINGGSGGISCDWAGAK